MLHRALVGITVRARRIGSKSYAVCVCGDGGVVPTTKPGKMYPVFAWEVLFVCVYEGRGGSQDRVWGERVDCTTRVDCVYVGAQCDIVWSGRKGREVCGIVGGWGFVGWSRTGRFPGSGSEVV